MVQTAGTPLTLLDLIDNKTYILIEVNWKFTAHINYPVKCGGKKTGNIIYGLPDTFLLQPKAIIHLERSAQRQSFHTLPLHQGDKY